LAEKYEATRQQQGIPDVKQLARFLSQPYRTIKNVMKLLKLCPQAKTLIRKAAKQPELRRRLSRAALEGIEVRGAPAKQVKYVRKRIRCGGSKAGPSRRHGRTPSSRGRQHRDGGPTGRCFDDK
jgi:hypothetical protein